MSLSTLGAYIYSVTGIISILKGKIPIHFTSLTRKNMKCREVFNVDFILL